jgi:septum formation protein
VNKLYLASQSPRRAQILKDLTVNFEILAPSEGEDTEALEIPLNNEPGLHYVSRVTLAKSQAAISRINKLPDANWKPILCADTTVCIDQAQNGNLRSDIILGKPQNDEQALEMLTLLNNRWHWVHTAVAIQKDRSSQSMMIDIVH